MGKSQFGLHPNVGPSFVSHEEHEQSKTETSTNRDADGIKHHWYFHCLRHRPWRNEERDRVGEPAQSQPAKTRKPASNPADHNKNQNDGGKLFDCGNEPDHCPCAEESRPEKTSTQGLNIELHKIARKTDHGGAEEHPCEEAFHAS
jgi:hypothetical protein